MHISFETEILFNIFGFPISNALIMSWLAIAVLAVLSILLSKKIKQIPGKLQSLAEVVLGGLFKFAESIIGDKEKTKKYFPFVATFFIFIITTNWFGLLPGNGSIGIHEHGSFAPLFRSVNSDLNMTFALAIISMVSIQIFGITAIGAFKYASKFINFKDPISFFVGILELVGEIAKILSFSFRLFGNIFAGEVLLMVIFFLVPYVAPLPFLMLELFVGFIQALIFTTLTLVFLKIAISENH